MARLGQLSQPCPFPNSCPSPACPLQSNERAEQERGLDAVQALLNNSLNIGEFWTFLATNPKFNTIQAKKLTSLGANLLQYDMMFNFIMLGVRKALLKPY